MLAMCDYTVIIGIFCVHTKERLERILLAYTQVAITLDDAVFTCILSLAWGYF